MPPNSVRYCGDYKPSSNIAAFTILLEVNFADNEPYLTLIKTLPIA
jgi:hypothetical protein